MAQKNNTNTRTHGTRTLASDRASVLRMSHRNARRTQRERDLLTWRVSPSGA